MKRSYCQRENEILEASRRGGLSAELEEHARSCRVCADAVAVSRFLQAEFLQADAVEPCPTLPDADFIWWKGQFAAKQAAVERATRSIALVKKISYLAAGVAAIWLVFAPGHLQSIMSALSRYDVWGNDGLRQGALLMAIGAMVFTVVGSLYLARAEK